ncbi:hypothetical protein KBK24_0121625 [Burkholderia sp. K24]|nr:hypothetical protein KBK24_0121625 [Burkholderia sp. K24]
MRNDITDWLSAAALIALISNECGTPRSLLRHASSALYLDQVAAPATPDPFIQMLLTGECFRPLYEYERALIQFKLAYPAAFK